MENKKMTKLNTYRIVYRFKGEGKTCYTSESKATSKKELRTQFDSSVVIKSIHTIEEWNRL